MARASDVPGGGLLEGVRVVYSAYSIAGPFAAAMLADMGADVIWVEHPKNLDTLSLRSGAVGYAWELDRRNQRDIALDIPSEAGREVFLKLVATADIFIEASRGGQYDKWGLTDEALWEVNPKLVIAHISGYGQTGLPDYVKRASYDPIAQAFSGFMWMNGVPGQKPYPPHVSNSDYYASYFTTTAVLAALFKAQKTGEGESIDISQYEATLRVMQSWAMEAWNMEEPRVVQDDKHNFGVAGFDSYLCKDGTYVYVMILGGGVCKPAAEILGIEYGSDDMPEGTVRLMVKSEAGQNLERKVTEFCAERDSAEVERIFLEAGIPCGQILNFKQIQEHPHVIERGTLTTWKNRFGQDVIGCDILPKLKKHPYQIWRCAPDKGEDNEDILADLGYNEEQIAAFFADGTVARPKGEMRKLPNGLKYYDWVK
jgi:L-carnitine CoA-transferase